VFRVFKLSRYGHRMQLIVDALQESREILLMLSVNLVILVSLPILLLRSSSTMEPHG